MADRYWVGGGSSTAWNATSNTNWSASSGGANNASVPTSADNAIFNGVGTNANGTASINLATTILSLNITSGFTGTIFHNAILTIAGNVTLGANYTITGTQSITVSAVSILTSNGKTWPNGINFTGGSTKTLADSWNVIGNLNINFATTTTISGLLTANAIIVGASFNAAFVGTFGWEVDDFINSSIAASIVTLQEGVTYTINNNLNSFLNRPTLNTFVSSSATNRAFLKLVEGAKCNTNASLTRIDASLGRPIRTWNGVVTDCVNVQTITDLETVAATF